MTGCGKTKEKEGVIGLQDLKPIESVSEETSVSTGETISKIQTNTKEETVSNEGEISKEKTVSNDNGKVKVDLIIFSGQSNMSGSGGDAVQAPALLDGAGGEFRAISDPTCLYTIIEPFGFYENTDVINDGYAKRGTLVTSFINAYYQETGIPVVAVSAARNGTSSAYWATVAVREDLLYRYRTAKEWLNNNGYEIRYQFIVFLQGENDVIEKTPIDQYLSNMYLVSESLYQEGLNQFFMIRIGGTKTDPDAFSQLVAVQTELCRTNPKFMLASTVLSAYTGKDMTDTYHYSQQVLNDLGDDAGTNCGKYANTQVEPSFYDYKYKDMYIPQQK